MCSDCVTLILFKEKEESSTIRLILIKCHKDYERSILYTYQALKSSLKVWQIYVLFPKCLPQPSQPWSVWSRKNILLDKFPLGIPTSGALLSFFATLHKNAKNSFKGIQWWHCYCWAAESVEGPKNYRRWKYLEVSVGCINSSSYVFSQFGYKPFVSFILLPLYFSDNQPLKLGCWSSTCLQPHAPLMICMLILELSAHLIVCKFSSLKAGSIYFLGLWVR